MQKKTKNKFAIFFFLTSQKPLIEWKYLTQKPILKEVGVLKEHLKFALFKLQSNNEKIFAATSKENINEM